MTFFNYLNSRRYVIFLIFLCSLVHIIVLYAYNYNTEPIYYASLIYLVLLIFIGVLDYLQKKRKHKLLSQYDSDTDMALQTLLPAKEPIEREYQSIIDKLKRQQLDALNTYQQNEKESSDFYTMWVHQIKTPIAALQLLLQASPENIAGMKGELFKIERYADVILNYLRMDNINQDLLLNRYSLETMVKQAVKKYAPLFISSRLSIKLENLEFLVLTDEKWLVFVIEQLFSNAIKYTKTGGVRIFAEVYEEKDKRISILTIEDTGIGICEEDIPRIFERAFTGYNGRNDKKASGLGLYLCNTILTKLGHEITITSVPQQGTKVSITFHENMSISGNLTKM